MPPNLDLGSPNVWRATLDVDGDRERTLSHLMSTDEQDRATRFYFRRDRRRFIVARAFLRLLLARYVGGPAGAIEFEYSKEGKPQLRRGSASRLLAFNLSHSDDVVVCAVAAAPAIGVDIEHVRAHVNAAELAEVVLAPREQKVLHAVDPADRDRAFVVLWALKEAYLKALGSGLAIPADSVDLTNAEEAGEGCAIRLRSPDSASFTCMLLAAGAYAAAIAVAGETAEAWCYDWVWESFNIS
jgi:4'-phosphopantetheinyl transferase